VATSDGTSIVSYTWDIVYFYGTPGRVSQAGPSPQVSFTERCGQEGSTADGHDTPLSVALTVRDSNGNTTTAANHPPFRVRAFTCGS
jgi:hypothetical protein